MIDFSQARTNMVHSQLQTAGVSSANILGSFEVLPRERFVLECFRGVSYSDSSVPVCSDRFLLEPSLHAKMLEAVQPRLSDIALDIGVGTGYSSAVISPLVTTVVALEESASCLNRAAALWDELNACNIVSFKGPIAGGRPEDAPYDIIFLNGAVSQIPDQLLLQLAPGGRLVAVVKEAGESTGSVVLACNLGEGLYELRRLFSAGCAYLPGFEPRPDFDFGV